MAPVWHQFGTSLKNVRFFKQFGGSSEHCGFLWPFSAVWRGLLCPPFFLFLSRISAHRCAPEASTSPMRTPRPPVHPPGKPSKRPQNALNPASQAAFSPFLAPFYFPIQTPLKRRPNALQTPFKRASVKRLQANVALGHKKRPSAGPKRKADVKQTSSLWTIRFALPTLYFPIY